MATVTRHCDRCGKQTPHSAETVHESVATWMLYTCTWCWTITRRRAPRRELAPECREAGVDVVVHRHEPGESDGVEQPPRP
jgi:uncharacterized Zn finger protein